MTVDTGADLVSCPEQAEKIVQELVTAPFSLETTPISLHPICILLRSEPIMGTQLLLRSPTLHLLSSLPNAIRSHIILVLHHILASITTSNDNWKMFAAAALDSGQIATAALIWSRLSEQDRDEFVRDMSAHITKHNVVLWLNSFLDAPGALCPSLISTLQTSVVSVYEDLSAPDYIPLVQNILQLVQHVQAVDHGSGRRWALLVRDIFRICPTGSLSDLCFITETALSYQPLLFDVLIGQFDQVTTLSVPDIILLMCLCCSRPYIDPILSPIFKLVSSKHHSVQTWKEVIRLQGNRAALLNNWGEIWIEDRGELGHVGSTILLSLFIDVEHSRRDILQLILTNITEYAGTSEVQDRYIALLSLLPMTHLVAFTSTIVDFIRYAGNLQPLPAKRLLTVLLPIVNMSNSALDQLILLFRKFMHSRLPLERSLGAFGLCELLRTAGAMLSLSVQLEIVSCVDASLNLPFQQRSMIYSSLRMALACSCPRLHQESWHALFKVLDRRLQRFITTRHDHCSLSLSSYVDIRDDRVLYHDNFPELIACHTLTIPHVVPKPSFYIADAFFMSPSKTLPILLKPTSQRKTEPKGLYLAVTFAGACERLAELIMDNGSLCNFVTARRSQISDSDLSLYLVEVASYVRATVDELVRNDSATRRSLSKCQDVLDLSPQFCMRILSQRNLSLLPLARIASSLSTAISKSASRDTIPLDDSTPVTNSSSSSSSDCLNMTALLQVCAPVFIRSLPWSDNCPELTSPLFKAVTISCKLDFRDCVSPFRHTLLDLITSSIRSLRNCLRATRICTFPVPKRDLVLVPKDNDAVDNMILSWSWALQSEFDLALTVNLGVSYAQLIQAAIKHASSGARERTAAIVSTLLTLYRINSVPLIKSLIHLLVCISPDRAQSLLRQPDQIRIESDPCRLALHDAVLVHAIHSLHAYFNAIKPYTKQSKSFGMQLLPSVQAMVSSCSESARCLHLISLLSSIRDDSGPSVHFKLRPRFILLISKLFMLGRSLIGVLIRVIAAVDDDNLADEIDCFSDIESCLGVISNMVTSIAPINVWMNANKDSISSKLVSSTVFRISTFEHDVASMIRSHRESVAADRLQQIGSGLRKIAKHIDQGDGAVSIAKQKRARCSRKQQHRSRIAYIDEALLEDDGHGSDAFADLEDWIVD